MAYGSMLTDGKDVRMSGQDVKTRNLFHRHAVIYDETSDKEYNRLRNIPGATGNSGYIIHYSVNTLF